MPRAICPQPGLTGMIDLTPSRCALKRIGGIDKRIFVGSLSDVAGFTTNTAGEIITLVMKTGKQLYALVGKPYEGNHNTNFADNPNATLYEQTVNFISYVDTQQEKNAIELLRDQDDLFVIVMNNYGRFEAFGLVGMEGRPAQGLRITGGGHGIEAAAGGGSGTPLTFTGTESRLPVYTNFADDAALEVEYLEALLIAA